MRDQHRRLVAAQPLQAAQNVLLGLRIDAGEAVVEQQHLGVADEAARQRGALLLPAGEGDAAFADHCGEAVVQVFAHRAFEAGGVHRVPDRLVAALRIVVGEVLAQRRGEEERILRNQSDHFAQMPHRQVADVAAVQEHAAAGRVQQAHRRLQDRRLASAHPPEQRHGFARAHVDVDAVDGRARRSGVAVGESTELQPPGGRRGSRRECVRGVRHFRLVVEDFVDALGARRGAHEHGQRPADLGHRVGEHHQIGGEGRPSADRQLA